MVAMGSGVVKKLKEKDDLSFTGEKQRNAEVA
jgi:hypothetical protein